MNFKEAVAVFEEYGITPSLVSNGIGFVRQAAEIIADLESDRPRLAGRLDVTKLNDGDVVVVSSTYGVEQDVLAKLKDHLCKASGKRIVLIGVDDDATFDLLSESDKARLLADLQPKATES